MSVSQNSDRENDLMQATRGIHGCFLQDTPRVASLYIILTVIKGMQE